MRITSESRTFQFASFTYDLAVSDVFCAFMRGACLCVPSEEDRLNDITHAFSSLRINLASITPGIAEQLDPEEVPSLQTLVVGGEQLPEALITRWANKAALINIYGITETVSGCTILPTKWD